MSARVFLECALLFLSLNPVHCDSILFKEGFIRDNIRHGRQSYVNVEHIDGSIVSDDVRLIIVKVKSSSMPVLHAEAVRNLQDLENISMTDCKIKEIRKRAFVNLPNLITLHLQDNGIQELTKGVFNGLSVKILTLQRNEIKSIESGAFDDMPNLFRIKLNNNRLTKWDQGWFRNSPKVTELYFRRNRIHHLPSHSFKNINGTHQVNGTTITDTKIFLSKNKLGAISPESFYGLERLSQLYLDRNNITLVPAGAFRDLKEVDVVYLARNKINRIESDAFPQIKGIGILDLSNNMLECLPWELVILVNQTFLERNSDACQCVERYKKRLLVQHSDAEIIHDEEDCIDSM